MKNRTNCSSVFSPYHAKKLPRNHRCGMNFGLTLSVWDYLFGSAYMPRKGRDIRRNSKSATSPMPSGSASSTSA